MIIKKIFNKLIGTVSESIYLIRHKCKIKENTIYTDVSINLTFLKRKKSPVNARYIVTNKPLPLRFIKKSGQTVVVVCPSSHDVFFGNIQRTLLMSDYLLCPENTLPVQLLREFQINRIYKGTVVSGYDENVLENIIAGKYKSKYHKTKKHVLIYSGSLAQNGITTSFLNLMSCLKNDTDTDYMITYRENSVKKFPERLQKLPEQYRKIPIAGNFMPTLSEFICYTLYFKLNISTGFIEKRIRRMFSREYKRLFGCFDCDTAVQFLGYEYGVIKLFEEADCKNVIFVHNDMVSEIKCRHNQHYLTLKKAYRSYDTVAAVTEDMRSSIVKISGTDKNVRIVPNCHDYKAVLEKSLMQPEFQSETESTLTLEKLNEILSSQREKFITIGRFSPEKAHKRLIDAFKDYCLKYPGGNPCLIIIGGRGELYEETAEYAKSTGLDIVLIRSMENPMPILKKCDLFMLPSEYEGLGLVLLEADTLGIPVFATNIPGPSCFLKEYGGLLVENSKEGILKGMELYREGKVPALNIDYEEYNKKAAESFRDIIQ